MSYPQSNGRAPTTDGVTVFWEEPLKRVALPIHPSASSSSTASGSSSGLTPSKSVKKKKVNAVSKSSLAMLHYGMAMGIEAEEFNSNDAAPEASHFASTSSSSSMSTKSLASSSSSSRSGGGGKNKAGAGNSRARAQTSASSGSLWKELSSPTPELEAFTVPDPFASRHQEEDSYEATPAAEMFSLTSSASMLHSDSQHSQQSSLGSSNNHHHQQPQQPQSLGNEVSVFEEDDHEGSGMDSKDSQSRKVVFMLKAGSSEGSKTIGKPLKYAKPAPATKDGGSGFARFFGFKKGSKNSSKKAGDEQQPSPPSSAPHNVIYFDDKPPPRRPGRTSFELGSSSNDSSSSMSISDTPMSTTSTLPTSDDDGQYGGRGAMPHRKNGPPPKSILRKQSAPALRERAGSRASSEESNGNRPVRPREAPPAMPAMQHPPQRQQQLHQEYYQQQQQQQDHSAQQPQLYRPQAPAIDPQRSYQVGKKYPSHHSQQPSQASSHSSQPSTSSGRMGPVSSSYRAQPQDYHPPRKMSSDVQRQQQTQQGGSPAKRYSSVGRGVARQPSTHSSLNSGGNSIIMSPPRRRQGSTPLPRRAESNDSGSKYDIYSSPYGPTTQEPMPMPKSGSASSISSFYRGVPAVGRDRRSMALKVADGMLDKSRGFEEPAPRSQPAVVAAEVDRHSLQKKAFRRRSRSVGSYEDAGNPFASAFGGFMSAKQDSSSSLHAAIAEAAFDAEAYIEATTPMFEQPIHQFAGPPALKSSSPVDAQDKTSSVDTARTPTQQQPAVFADETRGSNSLDYMPPSSEERKASSNHHRANDSTSSNSSCSSGSESLHELVATAVQVRRVQVSSMRARATAVNSPSLGPVTVRSPHPSQSQAPMVTVFPPTPDMAGQEMQRMASPEPMSQDAEAPADKTPEHEDATTTSVAAIAEEEPEEMVTSDTFGDVEELKQRYSSRVSCMLALSLASASLEREVDSDDEESAAILRGGIEPFGQMSYGFPSCPPVVQPLNIKRRAGTGDADSPSNNTDLSRQYSIASSSADDPFRYSTKSSVSDTTAAGSPVESIHPVNAAPRNVAYAPAGWFSSAESSGSVPSLSSDSTMTISSSDPRITAAASGGTISSAATSESFRSLATDFGASPQRSTEEAMRYVHRAQLSHDAFDGIIEEDEPTPRLASGAWEQQQNRKPSINVVAPAFEEASVDQDCLGYVMSTFPSGLSADTTISGRTTPMGHNGTRSPTPTMRDGARSVTPTQQSPQSVQQQPIRRPMRPSPPPHLRMEPRANSAPTTPSPSTNTILPSGGSTTSMHSPSSPLGLGLDLGQVKVSEPSMQFASREAVRARDSRAEIGNGRWEDHSTRQKMMMTSPPRPVRRALTSQVPVEQGWRQQQQAAYVPPMPISAPANGAKDEPSYFVQRIPPQQYHPVVEDGRGKFDPGYWQQHQQQQVVNVDEEEAKRQSWRSSGGEWEFGVAM